MKYRDHNLDSGRLRRVATLVLASCIAAVIGACSTPSTPQTQLAMLTLTMNPMCKAGNGPHPGGGTVMFSPPPTGPSATCVLKGENKKPAECVPQFPLGVSVTLTAAPASPPFDGFDGFTGSGCSGIANTCTI